MQRRSSLNAILPKKRGREKNSVQKLCVWFPMKFIWVLILWICRVVAPIWLCVCVFFTRAERFHSHFLPVVGLTFFLCLITSIQQIESLTRICVYCKKISLKWKFGNDGKQEIYSEKKILSIMCRPCPNNKENQYGRKIRGNQPSRIRLTFDSGKHIALTSIKLNSCARIAS